MKNAKKLILKDAFNTSTMISAVNVKRLSTTYMGIIALKSLKIAEVFNTGVLSLIILTLVKDVWMGTILIVLIIYAIKILLN